MKHMGAGPAVPSSRFSGCPTLLRVLCGEGGREALNSWTEHASISPRRNNFALIHRLATTPFFGLTWHFYSDNI
jgi:hypothetical protein